MNNFFSKIYIKGSRLLKSFIFGIGDNAKKRKMLIFGLLGLTILLGVFIFLQQKSDRFSSVSDELEEIDMTGLSTYIKHDVPFTSQAPSSQWQDASYQDACEEASIIIATHWINGEKDNISVGKAEQELEKLFEITKNKYGTSIDMSAEDTAELLREYSNSNSIEIVYDITLENIIRTLADNKIIIVPADGEWLDNKHFVGTGPERHMVVIVGYDYKKGEFITNDPGTSRGKDFRYSFDNLMSAMRNYSTGNKVPIDGEERRVMIVVSR